MCHNSKSNCGKLRSSRDTLTPVLRGVDMVVSTATRNPIFNVIGHWLGLWLTARTCNIGVSDCMNVNPVLMAPFWTSLLYLVTCTLVPHHRLHLRLDDPVNQNQTRECRLALKISTSKEARLMYLTNYKSCSYSQSSMR